MFPDISPETRQFLVVVVQLLGMGISLILWFRFLTSFKNHPMIQSKLYRAPKFQGTIPAYYALLAILCWLFASRFYSTLIVVLNQGTGLNFNNMETSEKLIHFIGISCTQLIMLSGLLYLGISQKKFGPKVFGFRKFPISAIFKTGGYTFILALLPVGLTILLTSSMRNEENMHEMFKIMQSSQDPLVFLLISLLVIVLAPLIEELLFRVFLQGWLQQINPAGGILCTALLFALVHGWPDSIALIPLAIILGVLYYWKRSYLANVLTHALFNAYNFLMALLTL